MVDIFTKKQRSYVMSRIKGSNTKPEIKMRSFMKNLGFIYQPKMLGNPDFVHKKKRVVIFIDGDFWHGYNWKKLGKVPPKRYWQKKIERNIQRDKKYNKMLKKKGWKVLRIWEHSLK